MTAQGFAREAKALRSHFDARFADPLRGHEGRFVWDFWHVPGEYTYLRTPAWLYFPPRVYQRFHQRLVWWGRRVLGCHDVSPPWLSCYVEGCEQTAHVDAPHGPWAWVFSLTNWGGHNWSGGRTVLFERPRQFIPPRFNQLCVFDPRVPHGVERVHGTRDPREGRLVIHGWFVQPRPFIEGPLSTRALAAGIEEVGAALEPLLQSGLEVRGMTSLGFRVGAGGRVTDLETLTDNTRSPPREEKARRLLLSAVQKSVGALRFPSARGASKVTLPFIFEGS